MHVDTNFVGLAVHTIYIASLSEGVFEQRKSTTSKAFLLLICLNVITFFLLSVFTPIEVICPNVLAKPLPKYAKSTLPVDMRLSKPTFLELPNDVRSTEWTTFKYRFFCT